MLMKKDSIRADACQAIRSLCVQCVRVRTVPVGNYPSRLYNLVVAVTLGSSRLLASGKLNGRRVGIVSNPASIDAHYTHIVDALITSPDVTVGAIFGPQHGFRSDVQDNMIETPHGNDCRRKVPVFSLYSETREPTSDMLRHVDLMVIDLQDI